MIMIYNIFEILATYIESSLCYRFVELFSPQPMDGKKRLILSIILTTIICLINFKILFSMSTLVLAVLFVAVTSKIVFQIPFFEALSITACYSFFLLFFDSFSMMIMGLFLGDPHFAFSAISGKSWERYGFIVISKMLLLGTYLLVKKVFVEHSRWEARKFIPITVGGYVGVIYFSKLTFEYIDENLMVIGVLLFAIMSLLLVSLSVYLYYIKAEEEKKIIEIRNGILAERYKEAARNYRVNAQLYHDMRNHINILEGLMESEKYGAVKEYIDSLSDISSGLQYTWTGNDIFDCILNLKKTVCDQEKIGLQIDADPMNIEIEPFVISTILSNLMDNAIEACKMNEEDRRWIYVAIRHINDMLIIKMKNPFTKEPERKKGILVTNKKNGMEHGWGLKNVDTAVKKADGVFTWKADNGEFVANVTIFL